MRAVWRQLGREGGAIAHATGGAVDGGYGSSGPCPGRAAQHDVNREDGAGPA